MDHPASSSLPEVFLGPHVRFLELVRGQDLSYDHEENYRRILDRKENNPELLILVNHLWVHNETGHVSRLEDLAKLKSIPDLYVHADSVQAPGKIPEWKELSQGDLWTFSGHKFGALKGVGMTLLKKGTPFHPLLTGGGQQKNFRSGTENPMGVRSLALALADLTSVDVKNLKRLRGMLVGWLSSELQGIGEIVSGPSDAMNANTVYFFLNNVTSDVALALFDLHGVMLSAGSACQSGAAKKSEVLLHLKKEKSAKNGLRISFGFHFGEDDLNSLIARMGPIFNRLRSR